MLILELLGRLALALIMQFPASVPARALPGSDAAWARAAQQTRGYHYAAWSPDVLADVHISKLADALPALDFVFGAGGRRRLPLHVIVFFLGRLGWVEDGSLAVNLTSGLSAATLVSFEAWADGDSRLDLSPSSETGSFSACSRRQPSSRRACCPRSSRSPRTRSWRSRAATIPRSVQIGLIRDFCV